MSCLLGRPEGKAEPIGGGRPRLETRFMPLWRGARGRPDAASHTVSEVRQADLYPPAGDADRTDAERHGSLLLGENMLDGGRRGRWSSRHCRSGCGRHRPALGLSMVDLAAEAVTFHEGLVCRGATRAVGPDSRAGIGAVEQPAAQYPPVAPAGVGHVPSSDKAVPAVDGIDPEPKAAEDMPAEESRESSSRAGRAEEVTLDLHLRKERQGMRDWVKAILIRAALAGC